VSIAPARGEDAGVQIPLPKTAGDPASSCRYSERATAAADPDERPPEHEP